MQNSLVTYRIGAALLAQIDVPNRKLLIYNEDMGDSAEHAIHHLHGDLDSYTAPEAVLHLAYSVFASKQITANLYPWGTTYKDPLNVTGFYYLATAVEYGADDEVDIYEFYTGPFATDKAARDFIACFPDEYYGCPVVTTRKADIPTYKADILFTYYNGQLGLRGEEIRDYLSDKPRQP